MGTDKRPTNARTSRIMATEQPQKTFAGPSKTVHADYPLIDNDPHFKRVIGYARTSDYAVGGLAALSGPGLMYAVEKFAPSHAGRGAFPKIMRLAGAIGITGGFLIFYQRSILRFYGATENRRRSRWTCARWSTRSSAASHCTASPSSRRTCRASRRDKVATRRCLWAWFPGSTL